MGNWGQEPIIPQFFAGRTLLITGATGFIGKVLIERLLWTCPEVSRLLLLMRPKRQDSPETRLTALKRSPVFEMIRRKCRHQLDKLWYIPGDLTLPQLGLRDESLEEIREVSVVFHCAATVKFDEPFRSAVEHNLRSVMRLMDICDTLPNMEAFVYTSTAYSNPEFKHVEERVYKPSMEAKELMSFVDASTDEHLQKVKAKLISPKPNTYTFTKAVAERAVQRRHGPYPVAVFRPSIVVSSLRHPFPGWIDSANGPSGVIVGTGKGLLHVFSCRSSALADLLPVDIAVDTLIAIAWETALDKLNTVRVYNCSTYENPTTWSQFQRAMTKNIREYPFNSALWYPSIYAIENRFLMRFLEIFLQKVPLHLAEYVSRIVGARTKIPWEKGRCMVWDATCVSTHAASHLSRTVQAPGTAAEWLSRLAPRPCYLHTKADEVRAAYEFSLITASHRLEAMNEALCYFALREWSFATDNVKRLRARLSMHDQAIYNLDPRTINWEDHNKHFIRGVRRYLLHEPDNNIHEARRRLLRLLFIRTGTRLAVATLVSIFTLSCCLMVRRRQKTVGRYLMAPLAKIFLLGRQKPSIGL